MPSSVHSVVARSVQGYRLSVYGTGQLCMLHDTSFATRAAMHTVERHCHRSLVSLLWMDGNICQWLVLVGFTLVNGECRP